MPLESVAVGDVLLVKPGARVPVDGTVVGEGTSSVDESMLTNPNPNPNPDPTPNPNPDPNQVDESMLTGESVPLVKKPGSSVVAGTTNQLALTLTLTLTLALTLTLTLTLTPVAAG